MELQRQESDETRLDFNLLSVYNMISVEDELMQDESKQKLNYQQMRQELQKNSRSYAQLRSVVASNIQKSLENFGHSDIMRKKMFAGSRSTPDISVFGKVHELNKWIEEDDLGYEYALPYKAACICRYNIVPIGQVCGVCKF